MVAMEAMKSRSGVRLLAMVFLGALEEDGSLSAAVSARRSREEEDEVAEVAVVGLCVGEGASSVA